mmetsp:Transcript_40810/g.103402  ORF Transcript_40810/g.103402 Transcript_40810/m.103402 type:complete len:212 (+) Transcript_40810:519-1154(+)
MERRTSSSSPAPPPWCGRTAPGIPRSRATAAPRSLAPRVSHHRRRPRGPASPGTRSWRWRCCPSGSPLLWQAFCTDTREELAAPSAGRALPSAASPSPLPSPTSRAARRCGTASRRRRPRTSRATTRPPGRGSRSSTGTRSPRRGTASSARSTARRMPSCGAYVCSWTCYAPRGPAPSRTAGRASSVIRPPGRTASAQSCWTPTTRRLSRC